MLKSTKSVTRRRKAVARRKAVRRAPVRARVPRRKVDYARVVEASELPIVTNATGQFTLNYTTTLSDFQRAQEVAHAYKYYRCAKVELIFVPYATFAQTNGLAAARMPQLYFTLDRVNNMWIQPTEAEMLERGISPKLFKRTYKFLYKPNLLQHVQLETNQPTDGGGLPIGIDALNAVNSIPVFNKWLPTQQSYGFAPGVGPRPQSANQVTQAASNPYALKYYGAIAVIDIEGGNNQQIGDLMTKVTWEFKSPRALKTNAPGAEPIIMPGTSMINPLLPTADANTQPTNYP